MPSSDERAQKPRRRFRRAAAWTGKAALRLAWGAAKLAAKGFWWAGKKGYEAGASVGRSRPSEARNRAERRAPPRRNAETGRAPRR